MPNTSVNGSGILRDGRAIQYWKNDFTYRLVEGGIIKGADGIPPREWQTVARDPALIPPHQGVYVDVDGLGPLEAADAGDAIIGWRLDVFAGSANNCTNPKYPNPILIGACKPATAACPARLPEAVPRPCPAGASRGGD
jgi:3D (Asp-Asp-Asp) domain-containing protein